MARAPRVVVRREVVGVLHPVVPWRECAGRGGGARALEWWRDTVACVGRGCGNVHDNHNSVKLTVHRP